MKATVNNYLNARVGSPTTSAANPDFKKPGDLLEITEVHIGEEYHGSAIWYKADDGRFYWSGGVTEKKFSNTISNFSLLTNSQKMIVVRECINELFDFFKDKVTQFTGLGLSFKRTSGEYSDTVCLCVHVAQKIDNPDFKIEPFNFKGFQIPTDVEVAQSARAIAQGETTSRKDIVNSGTVGFYVKDKSGVNYFLTNFHVVGSDFLTQNPPLKSIEVSTDNYPVSVPSASGNISGYFKKGVLNWISDSAAIKISSPSANKFTPAGILPFNDFAKVFKPEAIQVYMLGGVSQTQPSIVVSLYQSLEVTYFKSFQHKLNGLIKINKVTQPGDSGSPLKYQNSIIGLIVAEDDDYSYAIPIENIISQLNISI